MGKAKLAGFRLSEDQCDNGCCVLLRTRSDYSTNSKGWIGPRESNCSSVTGLDEASAQRSISKSTKANDAFVYSQRVQTRFTAPLTWCLRLSIRLSNRS